MSSAEAGDLRRTKHATIIANFRKQRMIRLKRTKKQVNRASLGQRRLNKDKKSLPGLIEILDADILSELTDKGAPIRLKKTTIVRKD